MPEGLSEHTDAVVDLVTDLGPKIIGVLVAVFVGNTRLIDNVILG